MDNIPGQRVLAGIEVGKEDQDQDLDQIPQEDMFL